MKDETIRRLVQWQAQKHNLILNRIRVGHGQSTRYGSCSRRGRKYNISISNYITDGESEEWNLKGKVSILDTILHEFAHILLFEENVPARHDKRFKDKYHDLLASEWTELVQMYNLLEGDNIKDDYRHLIRYNDDLQFNALEFTARVLMPFS